MNSESFTWPADMLARDKVEAPFYMVSRDQFSATGQAQHLGPFASGALQQLLERNCQVTGGHLRPEVTPPSITETGLPLILPYFSHFSKSWIWQISAYFNLLPIFCILLIFYFEKNFRQNKVNKLIQTVPVPLHSDFKTVEFRRRGSSFFLCHQHFFWTIW